MSIQRHQIFSHQHCDDEDDANMSSKALNDTALNQMIDEILYSTRKVRRLVTLPCVPVPPAPQATPNCTMQTVQASELAAAAEQTQPEVESTDEANSDDLDVRSPVPDVCQLRRQGGLRRKRAHRPAEAVTQMDALMASHPFLRQSIDILASLETPPKKMRWL